MELFLHEETMYNVAILMGLALLIAANGFFLYRISKVKLRGIRTMTEKMVSIIFSVAVVGAALWLAIELGEIEGAIISFGVLIALTRIFSMMAIGLTEDGIQYEVSGTTGGTGALASLIRIVQFVPYKDIKEIDIQESEMLTLKVDFSIRSLTLKFPIEKKEEVESYLKNKNVL